MKVEISKEFTFEASHVLPKHPGKCSRLHGHSWKLLVATSGEVNNETGFVIDYADLKALVQPLIDKLDHRHLGQWQMPFGGDTYVGMEGDYEAWGVSDLLSAGNSHFYPSSENLIVWIGEQLDKPVNGYVFGWSRLELNETCTSKCILMREDYEQARSSVQGQ